MLPSSNYIVGNPKTEEKKRSKSQLYLRRMGLEGQEKHVGWRRNLGGLEVSTKWGNGRSNGIDCVSAFNQDDRVGVQRKIGK